TLFSQRVTACEQRESLDACEACALRLGRLDASSASEFHASATRGRVSLARREQPDDSGVVVRPLGHKPWGASLPHEEQAERSDSRSMAVLTGACLVILVAGSLAERLGAAHAVTNAMFVASAALGGWYTARSTFAALSRLEFDVNLLMLLAA